MSRFSVLILLGITVLVLPLLGVPSSWKNPIYVVAGVLIALIALTLRGVRRSRSKSDTYEESQGERSSSDGAKTL